MIAPVRSGLVVLGACLVTAGAGDRRRRARWLGDVDPACWTTAPLAALASAIATGTDTVAEIEASMRDSEIVDPIATIAAAHDEAHHEADRWREHADRLAAFGRLERARWDYLAADHRLGCAGGADVEPEGAARARISRELHALHGAVSADCPATAAAIARAIAVHEREAYGLDTATHGPGVCLVRACGS